MSLSQKAGQAGLLLFFRKAWSGIVNLAVMAYLARNLGAEDFGVVAISGTLISFIQVFAVSGISDYVIYYNKEDKREILNAAFWLNLFLTILVSTVIILLAPYWAKAYGDSRIFLIVCLLVSGFFFNTVGSIPMAIFRKSLNYKPMVAILTAFGTVSQLSQAVLAYMDFGVYSLALPHAIISPILAFFLFYRSGFVPKNKLGLKYWKQIFGYTKHVIGTRILNKLGNEGDNLLIGKLLGMQILGVYDVAFKLANLLTSQLLPIVTNVALPVLSRSQNNLSVVSDQYYKMISMLAFVFFPLYGILILYAPQIVDLFYGDKWAAAVVPLRILSLFAVFRALSSPSAGLYNALGKPKIGFYFDLIFVPLLLGALIFGAKYGQLVGVCLAVMLIRNLASFVHLFIVSNLLKQNIMRTWKEIKSSLIISSCLLIVGLSILDSVHLVSSLFYVLLYIVIFKFVCRNDFVKRMSLMYKLIPIKK